MKQFVRHAKFLLLLLTGYLFSTSLPAYAQLDPVKFGKIEMPEIQLKAYDKDTSAEAVILGDFGKSYFQYSSSDGFQVFFERIIRIKILKKSGYDWATGQIAVYKSGTDEEKITSLQGVTYNEEGGKIVKTKLNKDAMFVEQVNDNWSLKKFTMPNVKEGSIVEYAYTIKSDFAFNFREWEFQHSIPVVWSEYRAVIPEYFNYRQFAQGYEPFHIHTQETSRVNFSIRIEAQSYATAGLSSDVGRVPARFENVEAQATSYRWVTKDVPAFKEEPYMTTVNDYLTKIEFELASIKYPGQIEKSYTNSWESMTRSLLESEHFGLQLNRAGFLKNEITAITAQFPDPTQRMAAVSGLVRKSMKWNGVYGKYSAGIRKSYENKIGNSADINLLLTATLQEAGLDANPVVLSTRDYGRLLESYVLLSKFNYVITHVAIGDKEYLLDATDPLLAFTILPAHCLNGSGRLIAKQNPRWIPLQSSEKISRVVSAKLHLDPAGELKGTVDVSDGGYRALMVRKALQSEGKDKYVANIQKLKPSWQIARHTFTDVEETHKSLSARYELAISDHAQVAGNLIYLKPMLTEGEKENPFKLENRKFPVDFSAPMDETYVCTFTVPEGYQAEELPKGVILSLPDNGGKFTYMTAMNGNQIQVSSRITLKKPVFYAEEYNLLKEFYTQIVNKHAEQIVLKKAN